MSNHDRSATRECKKQEIKDLTRKIRCSVRKERAKFSSARAMAKSVGMGHTKLSWWLDQTPKDENQAETGIQRFKLMHIARKSLIQLTNAAALSEETRRL